jgi:hypothetical protein
MSYPTFLTAVEREIRELTDPDPCWLDHRGGCQAHGYLSLKPGEVCPHAEAKELLASLDGAEARS